MLYHLITLGCQMNVSDSERVRSILQQAGFTWTDDEEKAELLGILACSVRQKAIDKVYSRIYKWNRRKDRSNLITFVSGCVLPADREKFLKLFDLVFTMSEAGQLPDMIREYGVTTGFSARHDLPRFPSNEHIFSLWKVEPAYNSAFEAFVPIQNGCDKFCTFCAVPYTRGREVSRPSAEILEEVEKLVNEGYKSITLLGQNVNSYGKDRNGSEISFAALLEGIGKLGISTGKEFLVYYTSPHPRDMGRDVIDVMAEYKVIAKMVHLPMQSGDDKVLVKMNRGYTLEKYRETVSYIREKMPEATLFTDIIVGFTGESEEQFLNTCTALEELKFNMAYIAKYSARPGAASYRWDDDISPADKKSRYERLTGKLAKVSREYNKNLVGKKFRVLVTGKDRKPGFLQGITEGRIIVRFASSQESLIGTFVDVSITSSADFSIEGELVFAHAASFKLAN